jgi:FKBP-type peptidyl-prolyl cis-trans isomerase (trigger factor)
MKRAENRIKSHLLIHKIAVQENIQVTDEEMEPILKELEENLKKMTIPKGHTIEGERQRIYNNYREGKMHQKVFDFLLEQSKKSETEISLKEAESIISKKEN